LERRKRKHNEKEKMVTNSTKKTISVVCAADDRYAMSLNEK
jgi:hypothetical protein